MKLISEKDLLEQEIQKVIQDLSFYSSKNLDKDLVDEEGFPRADIDFGELTIYRQLKQKLDILNNDLTAHMKKIEKSLVDYHSEIQQTA